MAASVGIDVGGTKCLAVLLVDGVVVADRKVATPPGAPDLIEVLSGLVEALDGDRSVSSVGVGMPGLVDRLGVVRSAPNLAGAQGLAVRHELQSRLGRAVSVDNDATCAALGEVRLGAAVGFDDVIMVTLGTGIGGGIVAGGDVLRGANGFAGEVGHMVVDPCGPPCRCGRRGCWERFASGSALGRLGREAVAAGAAPAILAAAEGITEAVEGRHVTAAAAGGDPGALEVMDRFATLVALGLANLCAVLDPQAVVVGGGLIAAGDVLLGPVRHALASMLMAAELRPPVAIVGAALGERAGAVGAACLGLSGPNRANADSRVGG